MMFKTPEDVAKEFRRRHGRRPDPNVWQWAIKRRLIRDAIDDSEEVDAVFDQILEVEMLRRGPRGGPRERRKDLPPDQRAIALARILASEAARHPLVDSFRADCLQGKTIKSSRIKSWIEEREHEQGEPARYVKRWERMDGRPVKLPTFKTYGIETRREFGELSSGVFLVYPGGSVQVSPDSVLGRLKFSATALRYQFLWPSADTQTRP